MVLPTYCVAVKQDPQPGAADDQGQGPDARFPRGKSFYFLLGLDVGIQTLLKH